MTDAIRLPEMRCMHNQPPNRPESSVPEERTLARGVVVCAHVYGVGVYLPEIRDFGHVNVPELGVAMLRDLDDYPAVGTVLSLTVIGRSGSDQLRLGVIA